MRCPSMCLGVTVSPSMAGDWQYLDYGQARITVDGESEISLMVFGEDDAPTLLGTYTITGLALAVDSTEPVSYTHLTLPTKRIV